MPSSLGREARTGAPLFDPGFAVQLRVGPRPERVSHGGEIVLVERSEP